MNGIHRSTAPASRRHFLRTATAATFVAGAFAGCAASAPFADPGAYGAAGNGVDDDTDALQQAIDAGGGHVYLGQGRYRLTRALHIDLSRVGPLSILGDGSATLVMDGAGPALHVTGSHDGTASPDTVTDQTWRLERMPVLEGFEILGTHPESGGVLLEGTMQCVLSRLLIRGTAHAVRLHGRNRNVIIAQCHLYDNTGVGIYMDRVDLHQINVVGSHISYNRGGGIVARGSEIRNLHVGTCDLEANMGGAEPPTANILLDAREGRVREVSIVGCTVQHTRDAEESANIRLIGRQEADLYVGRMTIADNILSDAVYNLHLQHARGVTVSGNTSFVASKHDVLIERSSHVILSDNLFERNEDYGDLRSNVVFRECRECTISNNHIHGTLATEAGLVLDRCEWVNVCDGQMLDCENAGALLQDCSHCRVSGNLIRARSDDEAAVIVRGGFINVVTGNLLVGQIDAPDSAAFMRDNVRASLH